MTMDYESAGALDILAPDVQFDHAWTRRVDPQGAALQDVLMQPQAGTC